MACFAAEWRSVCAAPGHAVLEFTMMWINVASSTNLVLEMEGKNLVGASSGPNLVALIARDGHVRARQSETSLAMICDRKCGAVEVLNRVAAFTAVLIRGGGELPVVRIFVAIQADSEFHLVQRFLTCGKMAFRAIHGSVLAEQWILRCRVLFHVKKGWLPTIHGVTFGAFAFFGTILKLAFVRIGLMAIGAYREHQGPSEVPIHMAIGTANLCV